MSDTYADFLERLGVDLDLGTLVHALTHRSFAFENPGVPHNERLEFLGDSVLGLVVTTQLYERYADAPESALAKMRSAIVNTHALAATSRSLGVGAVIRLGKGERKTGGADRESILADALESLIGAVFLSRGQPAAADLILRLLGDLLDDAEQLGATMDLKTTLQEESVARGLGLPRYDVASTGPEHEATFVAEAMLDARCWGRGEGPNKKEAQLAAAAAALVALRAEYGGLTDPGADRAIERIAAAEGDG